MDLFLYLKREKHHLKFELHLTDLEKSKKGRKNTFKITLEERKRQWRAESHRPCFNIWEIYNFSHNSK